MRDVVIAPNWLGDAVMSLPALAALRAADPGRTWTVLARPAVAPVYTMAGYALWSGGRAREAVVLPNSFHSALTACRLGARRRLGYARDARGWLLRPAVPPPEAGTLPGHESFRYMELLRRGGLITELPKEEPEHLRVPLAPAPERVEAWRAKLGGSPAVAMHVGATFGSAKRWFPERFAQLAGALSERGARVALVGGAAEREVARQVRMMAPHPERIKNFAGETTLEELAALLAAADAVVANDSGPMHLAGAVGTPVVAIFGATNEKETYPLTPVGGLRLIKAPGIECSPCKLRECPIDHRCMDRISVATVLQTVVEVLCIARPH